MRTIALSLAVLFALSACSGGSDSGAATTTTSTMVDETTTTSGPTTTSTQPATTVPLPAAPFTGLPFAGDPAALQLPAVAVKVDNHPRSRPQTGLDRADMVIELRAEGVTRFIAVYHSELPEPVGPVRSARTSDYDLLTALNEPVFAYSGANTIVDRGLVALPIYARYEDRVDFFRAQNRNAPHNLYVNPAGLQEKIPDGAQAPEPWFRFGTPDEVGSQGRAISGPVTVIFQGSPVVLYQWDRNAEGWLRTQDGASHSTVGGDQLAPANVVILETRYGVSPADAESPELVSIGSGDATVLTDGRVISGTWSRQSAQDPPAIVDDRGEDILLTPGQVWVMWPDRSVIIPES